MQISCHQPLFREDNEENSAYYSVNKLELDLNPPTNEF